MTLEINNLSQIATLTFDLTDQDAKENFNLMLKSKDLYFVLYDIYNKCREIVKYKEPSKELSDFCEDTMQVAGEYLDLLS